MGTFFVAAIIEYNELYRNTNEITGVVNNSLIIPMAASDVIKTDSVLDKCVMGYHIKNSDLCL